MTIPNLLVPFVAVEIDNTQAQQGPAAMPYRALIIGQRTSGGAWSANTLHLVTNAVQVATGAGRGSMLHRQALAWFAANTLTELWVGVLDDNGAGTAAAGSVNFAGPATAAGTINLYVGGTLVQVPVTSAMTAAQIATAAAALFPSVSDMPVTGAVDGSVTSQLNLTFRHKGTVGNECDIRIDYQVGEALPAGVTATITAMSSGATNPSLSSLITALGDKVFHILAHPYTDSTSLLALEAELARRFGPTVQADGVAFTATNDSVSAAVTLGNARNSPSSVIVANSNSPTPPMESAAHIAATVALYANPEGESARPLQTLPLPWVKAPSDADQITYNLSARNTLLGNGIATIKVGAGDLVQIERLVTTYQKNAAGGPDTSFMNVETMLTLMYLRFSVRALLQSKFPRHKLADDGTLFGPGQAVVTPKLAKVELLLWFKQMEKLALVEDSDQFERDLVVVRDSNPNQLDITLPPNLVNQLINTAATIQFRL